MLSLTRWPTAVVKNMQEPNIKNMLTIYSQTTVKPSNEACSIAHTVELFPHYCLVKDYLQMYKPFKTYTNFNVQYLQILEETA